jgi:LysM repeat protein
VDSKSALVLIVLGTVVTAGITSAGNHGDAKPVAVAAYAPAAPTYTERQAPAAPKTYVVQPGDGLKAIADGNGVTLGALLGANGFADSTVTIYPGQVLRLPDGQSPMLTPPVATAATTVVQAAPTYQAPAYVPPSYDYSSGRARGGASTCTATRARTARTSTATPGTPPRAEALERVGATLVKRAITSADTMARDPKPPQQAIFAERQDRVP